jgi:hypothetical protein
VILPLLTVILTWTGPQRVSIESPVTVLVAAVFVDDAAEGDGLDEADGAPVEDEPVDGDGAAELGLLPGVVPTATGTVATGVVWVLNDNNPTNPAMVPKIASNARRMGMPFSVAQNSKDS